MQSHTNKPKQLVALSLFCFKLILLPEFVLSICFVLVLSFLVVFYHPSQQSSFSIAATLVRMAISPLIVCDAIGGTVERQHHIHP
jgi:hypothetical protein